MTVAAPWQPERRRNGWWLLAPAVVALAVLTLWPLGQLVYSSLFRRSLTAPGQDDFVGLDVLGSIVASPVWWRSVALSIVLVAVVVLAQLLLASLLALALRRLVVPAWVTVPLLVTPFALLSVVNVSIWRDAFTTGFLPAWFGPVGFDGGETGIVGYAAVVTAEVWRGTGITTLILLAGLRRMQPSLLESAVADGATAWQRIRRVVLPAVAPAAIVAVIYRALDALRMFEGPLLTEADTRLRTAPLLVWDAGFGAFEIGLASALAFALLLVAAVLGGLLALGLRIARSS